MCIRGIGIFHRARRSLRNGGGGGGADVDGGA